MATNITSKLVQFTYSSHKDDIASVLSSIYEYGSIAFIVGYDGTWADGQDTTYKPSPEILPGNVIFANGIWYGTNKDTFEEALKEFLDTLEVGHKEEDTIEAQVTLDTDTTIPKGTKYSEDGVTITTAKDNVILSAGTSYYPVTVDVEASGLFKDVDDLNKRVDSINYFSKVNTISGDSGTIMGAAIPGAELTLKSGGSTSIETDPLTGVITISSEGGDVEINDNSESFKIGNATYSLALVDGKLSIVKVEYSAPSVSLSVTDASLEYESGTQEVTVKASRSNGSGYGKELQSASINNGIGDILESIIAGTVTKKVSVSANTTFTLTYTYLGSDGKTSTTGTRSASVSYNKYRWYVSSTEPTQVSDIKSLQSFATGLKQVSSLADGYTYVAVPAIWCTSEDGNVQGNTPLGVVFKNVDTGMAGGWVYWSTIESVYTNVNYYVYRTTNQSMVNTYTISKKS